MYSGTKSVTVQAPDKVVSTAGNAKRTSFCLIARNAAAFPRVLARQQRTLYRRRTEVVVANLRSLNESIERRCSPRLYAASEASVPEEHPSEVFVAGATGRTGIRVVRELTSRGIKVRAGARDPERALAVLSGAGSAAGVGYTGAQEQLLEPADLALVECVRFDLTDTPEALRAAIGGAPVVVAATGAPESEALNPALPRMIDGEGASALVQAAASCGVQHFLMVSSLGTGKFGLPAAFLNLFWNVLDWKRQAEVTLMTSGMKFTILRPGGMERPTDDYRLTHSTVLYPQDTQFGGQVSRLQVAEVCAEAVCHPSAAGNKVLEVVAEEGAAVASLPAQMDQVAVNLANLVAPAERPSAKQRGLEVMAFRGAAPEAVNGRLAMLGSLALILGQLRGEGTVLHQLALHWGSFLLWTAVVGAASIVPLMKGASIKDAELGVFTARLECFHGRAAMFAIGTMIATEVTSATHAPYLSFLPFVQ